MVRAVVGLGTNLGDRLAFLARAVAAIEAHAAARVLAVSPVYETSPVGGPPQGDFLNAAVCLTWDGEPLALLDALLAIERELGRVRDAPTVVRWGPRTIDLDILWIDGLTLSSDRLTVPHPRLAARAFALLPLLDVAPELAPSLPSARTVDAAGVVKTALVVPRA